MSHYVPPSAFEVFKWNVSFGDSHFLELPKSFWTALSRKKITEQHFAVMWLWIVFCFTRISLPPHRPSSTLSSQTFAVQSNTRRHRREFLSVLDGFSLAPPVHSSLNTRQNLSEKLQIQQPFFFFLPIAFVWKRIACKTIEKEKRHSGRGKRCSKTDSIYTPIYYEIIWRNQVILSVQWWILPLQLKLSEASDLQNFFYLLRHLCAHFRSSCRFSRLY